MNYIQNEPYRNKYEEAVGGKTTRKLKTAKTLFKKIILSKKFKRFKKENMFLNHKIISGQ